LIVVDTSVAVPAALPEHVAHRSAHDALQDEQTRAIAHVAVETYSVLTRLPRPQRVAPDHARAYLADTFAFPPLVLAPAAYGGLLDLAAAEGITGGALYDAVVAATAAEAGATLLTRDRRAVPTYRLVGAEYRFLA
jgi:predicted nucleic acid-binding protein